MSSNKFPLTTQTITAMNTVITWKIVSPPVDISLDHLLQQRINELEAKLSFFNESSDVSRINRQEDSVFEETKQIIKRATYWQQATHNAFNPWMGHAKLSWSQAEKQQTIPTVKTDTQLLDLGGIAKGYTVDSCLQLMKQHHLLGGFIDIGGNIGVIGHNAMGQPWHIGIQDPDKNRNTCFAVFSLSNQTIATSGSYERYVKITGTQYSHIFDPITGKPVESDLNSVSVFASHGIDADAVATACIVVGKQKALELIHKLHLSAIIYSNHEIFCTKNLQSNLLWYDESIRFNLI